MYNPLKLAPKHKLGTLPKIAVATSIMFQLLMETLSLTRVSVAVEAQCCEPEGPALHRGYTNKYRRVWMSSAFTKCCNVSGVGEAWWYF
jgi:hypothetical protein